MLRLANYYGKTVFSDDARLDNLPSFDDTMKEIGPENIVQIFAPSGGPVLLNRILYEDSSGPRSTCPSCHGFIRPEDDFCGDCGAPLHETVCQYCGTTVRPGKKFCTKCGAPLVVLKVKSIGP